LSYCISEDGIKIDSSDQGYHDYLKMGLASYSKNIKLQGDVILVKTYLYLLIINL